MTPNSPKLIAPNGQFLGNVNANRYDPNSIANPYGQYGSQYAPNGVNNQIRAASFGSPYSPTFCTKPLRALNGIPIGGRGFRADPAIPYFARLWTNHKRNEVDNYFATSLLTMLLR